MQQATLTTEGRSLRKGRKLIRILYADDLRELRDLFRISLARRGHDVMCVADGYEAFAVISEQPLGFDLIITDHQMPGMNGLEFVYRLRTTPFAGKLIVFSEDLTPATAQACEALGVDCMLRKPTLPATIHRVIDDLFRLHEKPASWA